MRIVVPDLLPGTDYAIQVRADGGAVQSEWSPIFEIETIYDVIKPVVPTGVTWAAIGDSFHAEWNAVNTNTGGDIIPIDRYEVELSSGGIVKIDSVPPATGSSKVTYDLSFEANRALFGTPKPSVTFRVRSVDVRDLKSDWSAPITTNNATPASPTNVTALPGIDSIIVSWTPPGDNDLIGYNVYVGTADDFTTAPANKVFFGDATSFTYKTSTYTAHFFKVRAVDNFGQESSPTTSPSATPSSSFAIDTTAPAVPTALAGTITNNPNGIGARANISWTMSNPPSDLTGFYVRYRKTGDTFYSTQTFAKADRAGIIELGSAYTNYVFQIKSFDWASNESAWSTAVTINAPANTAPGNVSGLQSVAGRDSIRYSWTASSDADIKNYELQFTSSTDFSTGVTTFNSGTATSLTVGGLSSDTIYRARVRAVDTQGATSGAWSSVDVKATKPQLTGADIGAVDVQAIVDAEISAIVRSNESMWMNKNPLFEKWTGSYPTFFQGWDVNFAIQPVRETNIVRTGTSSVRFDANSETILAGMEMHPSLYEIPYSKYVTIEVDVYLESGTTFEGSGVLLDWVDSDGSHRSYLNLGNSLPNPQVGKWYRVTQTIKRPPQSNGTFGSYNGWLMANWGELGSISSKSIIFDKFGMRHATSEEINAYESEGRANTARSGAIQDIKGMWGSSASNFTLIDGGYISTKSIQAKSLAIADFTNYFSDPYMLNSSMFQPSTYLSADDPSVPPDAPGPNVSLLHGRDHTAFNNGWTATKPGDQWEVQAYICATDAAKSPLNIGVWWKNFAENADNAGYVGSFNPHEHRNTWTRRSVVVTTPNELWSGDDVPAKLWPFLQIEGGQWFAPDTEGSNGGWMVTNISVRRRFGGELLVDGSVSASVLKGGTITATDSIILGPGANMVTNGGYIKSNTYGGTDIFNNTSGAGYLISNDGIRIDTGRISAETFVGGTFNGGQINIAPGGSIKGGNFILNDQGLTIPDGAIAASKIMLQSGENLMPYTYAGMEGNKEWFGRNITIATGSGGVIFDSNPNAWYGAQSLGTLWGTNTSPITLVMAPGDDVYNVDVEPGSTYIFSAYAWVGGPVPTNLELVVRWNNGTYATLSNEAGTVKQATMTGGLPAAKRLTGYAVAPSGASKAQIRFTSTTLTAGGGYNVDGIQVERKTSASNLPSPWRAPGATTIDAYSLKTGKIQSTQPATQANGTAIPDSVAWSIDMEGDAILGSAMIRGNVIVGRAEDENLEDPIVSYMASANYVPGTKGWKVSSTGQAEFRDVVTGSLSPSALDSGEIVKETSIELNGAIEAYGANSEVVGFSSKGFYSRGKDSNGAQITYVDFPTNGALPNIISGVLNATSINVGGDINGNAASFAKTNTLLPEGKFILQSKVRSPNTAATASVSWDNAEHPVFPGREYRDMTIGHDGQRYILEMETFALPDSTFESFRVIETRRWRKQTRLRIRRLNTTDEVMILDFESNYSNNHQEVSNTYTEGMDVFIDDFSMTYVPHFLGTGQGAFVIIYTLRGQKKFTQGGQTTTTPINEIKYEVRNTSWQKMTNNSISGTHVLNTGTFFTNTNGRVWQSAGTDFTTNRAMLGHFDTPTNSWRIFNFSWNATNSTLNHIDTRVIPSANESLSSNGGCYLVAKGSFDFGGNRLVWADTNQGIFKTFTDTGTTANNYVQVEAWNIPFGVYKGFTWNHTTGGFESAHQSSPNVIFATQYEGGGNYWTTGTPTENWSVNYSFWDSVGTQYETSPSTIRNFQMQKRAKLTITTEPIPYSASLSTSPDRARIFLSTLAHPAFGYVGHIDQPARSWVFEGQALTFGPVPGALPEFPQVNNPAKILGQQMEISGDGTAQFVSIREVNLIGEIRMWSGTTLPVGGNWLWARGGTFSLVDYPELAAIVGDKYGTHSGNTYYLPNFTNRFPRGNANPGAIGGSETKSLGHQHVGVQAAAQEAAGFGLTTSSTFRDRVIVTGAGSTAVDVMNPWMGINFIIRAK